MGSSQLPTTMTDTSTMLFHTKTIMWKDTTGEFHMNNILLQNRNGPCFIISFVNTLILSTELGDFEGWSTVSGSKRASTSSRIAQTEASNRRKLLAENLTGLKDLLANKEVWFDSILHELTHVMLVLNESLDAPVDIGAILNVLPHLGTGLNVNLRLNSAVVDDFEEQTTSVRALLELFGLHMVHGFFCDVEQEFQDSALDTFDKCQDYLISVVQLFSEQDVQLELLGDAELAELLERCDDEQKRAQLDKFRRVRSFIEENRTQLTEAGLQNLSRDETFLRNDSVQIFFRNDHFGTLYKADGRLYLLANDEGYGRSDAVVWEELCSVHGEADRLLNGTFLPSEEPESAAVEVAAASDAYEGSSADRELAAQLQSEEDESIAREMQRRFDKQKGKAKTGAVAKSTKRATKPAAAASAAAAPAGKGSKEGRSGSLSRPSSAKGDKCVIC